MNLKKLAAKNSHPLHYDEQLGFSITDELPIELRNRWLMFTQM